MKARKPNGQSPLQLLPEASAQLVIEWLKTGTLAATRERVKRELGVSCSESALSSFYSWWHLRRQFSQWEDDTKTMLDLLQQEAPTISEAKLAEYGNAFFQLKAVKSEDAESYVALMSARHRAEMDRAKLELRVSELKLKRQKFEFDAAKACLAALPALRAIASDRGLDQQSKIEAIRLKLFGDAAKEAQ